MKRASPLALGYIAQIRSVKRKNELRALLKKTQSLPQIQTLTEEDILAEIEAYRKGQVAF